MAEAKKNDKISPKVYWCHQMYYYYDNHHRYIRSQIACLIFNVRYKWLGVRIVFFVCMSYQYKIRISPFSANKVSFQAPENANIWSFQVPENSKKALPDFRGLKKPIRCLFRPLKTPTYGHFRPLKTPKRLFLISGAWNSQKGVISGPWKSQNVREILYVIGSHTALRSRRY